MIDQEKRRMRDVLEAMPERDSTLFYYWWNQRVQNADEIMHGIRGKLILKLYRTGDIASGRQESGFVREDDRLTVHCSIMPACSYESIDAMIEDGWRVGSRYHHDDH